MHFIIFKAKNEAIAYFEEYVMRKVEWGYDLLVEVFLISRLFDLLFCYISCSTANCLTGWCENVITDLFS